MDFTIDHAAINRLLTSPSGPVVRMLTDVGNDVEQNMKVDCPVDEGQLRASIDKTITVSNSEIVIVVGSPLPQAAYVNFGTGIYGPRGRPITPKHGRFLVFEPGRSMGPLPQGGKHPAKGKRGKKVFAKSVRGRPPNPFFVAALRRASPWPVRER